MTVRTGSTGGTLRKCPGRLPPKGEAIVSATNGTAPNAPRRRRSRQLPEGWSIIDGMGQPALHLLVDPVIEQTREMAHILFSASLGGSRNLRLHRCPVAAAQAWSDHALRRRDAGLARILEAMDAETFAETWLGLVRRLERVGDLEMSEWLQRRIDGST